MVLNRLKQMAFHMDASIHIPHPFDPLSAAEIDAAVALVRAERGPLNFNAVTLWEPRKAEMMPWLADPENAPRPHRVADIVAIAPGGKIYDGVVDLNEKRIVQWQHTEGVQPLITMADLQAVEVLARQDPKIIEQCGILGIPPEDMHKVYCDRERLSPLPVSPFFLSLPS
jgi:primary-amine oxidase